MSPAASDEPRLSTASEPIQRERLSALALLAFKGLSSAVVLACGFRALSDDDYARVVLAQGFAAQPQWDPSGTSWLPLPFWVYGGVLTIAGKSLLIARCTAFVLGLLAALGTWLAGGWLGLSARGRWLGTALSLALPYVLWLGVATVPDYPTAVLLLLAAASTQNPSSRVRLAGALAAGAACLCRYEAWPLAVTVAAYAVWDRRKLGNGLTLALVALSCLPALSWMTHGSLHHGDALFFVKRVAAYRRAIGAGGQSLGSVLTHLPVELLRGAAELWAALVTLLCFAPARRALGRVILRGDAAGDGRSLARGGAAGDGRSLARGGERRCASMPGRAMLALGSVLAFLVYGELRDGAPTHHAERTLLALWLALALLVGEALVAVVAAASTPKTVKPRPMRRLTLVAVALAAMAAGALRFQLSPTESFGPRGAEAAFGAALARRLPEGERLAIASRDYGYLALQAAFARPGRSEPLESHDPRQPKAAPLDSPARWREAMSKVRAEYVALPDASAPSLPPEAELLLAAEGWRLVRIRPFAGR